MSGVSPIFGLDSFLSARVDDKPEATGNGGDVLINAQTFLMDNGASLSAKMESAGNAGNLPIIASGDMILRGEDRRGFSSQISTKTEGTGSGGKFTLKADHPFLMEGVILDVDTEISGRASDVSAVALLVSLTSEPDDRLGIRAQLHPTGIRAYLPANLTLAMLSETEETIQQVQARDRDNCIQLKRFKCPAGNNFSLQIVLDEVQLKQDFAV